MGIAFVTEGRLRAVLLPLVLFAMLNPADRSSAQLSPGKLSQAHAEIDSSSSCLQCHATGQGVSAELCLSCHTLLGERIRADAGLHARRDYQQCETCHIEHHGREFELIWWGKEGIEAFDHDDTGYSLVGAHQVDCRQCHQASMILEPALLTAAGKDLDRTFLGLGTECASCHQDPHRGQMAPRGCDDCHGEETWTPAPGFDHDQTAFPLDGQHLQAECAQCHATETDADGSWVIYSGTPTACVDCHEDPHRGRLGRDCAACHSTEDWQRVDRERFNHDLTRFPLRGLHVGVACASCHQEVAPQRHKRSTAFRIAGYDDCATCHADVHVGQFRDRATGSACSDCHDVNGFVPSRFDTDDHAETRFPLDGAHRTVPCISCHLEVATAELVARGVAVAAPDMPLTALDFRIEATECADCHRDPHAGTADAYFGDAGCMSCHDGEDWTSVSLAPVPGVERFNHNATGFELEGAHRTVGCSECHAAVTLAPASGDGDASDVLLSFEGAPTTCRGCHEDPHLGQFDTPEGQKACRDCHSMEGWSPSIFDHNHDSVFPLEGAHARAECSACHFLEPIDGQEVVRYKPLPTACSGCHSNPEPEQPEPLPNQLPPSHANPLSQELRRPETIRGVR